MNEFDHVMAFFLEEINKNIRHFQEEKKEKNQ